MIKTGSWSSPRKVKSFISSSVSVFRIPSANASHPRKCEEKLGVVAINSSNRERAWGKLSIYLQEVAFFHLLHIYYALADTVYIMAQSPPSVE